jgi:hypothetical protein
MFHTEEEQQKRVDRARRFEALADDDTRATASIPQASITARQLYAWNGMAQLCGIWYPVSRMLDWPMQHQHHARAIQARRRRRV